MVRIDVVEVVVRMDAASAAMAPTVGFEEASEAVEDSSFEHHMVVGPQEGMPPCRRDFCSRNVYK